MSALPERSVSVIVVAAGIGRRMGGSMHKAWLPLDGVPVVEHTLSRFASLPLTRDMVLVVHADDRERARTTAERFEGLLVVTGGEHRTDSVRAGLEAVDARTPLIAIQDGVRPLVERELIERVCLVAHQTGAAIPGIPLHGTIKEVDPQVDTHADAVGRIVRTVCRERLYEAQTPQVFRADLLRRAYRQLKDDSITDDAQAVSATGFDVTLVAGSPHNLKITTPEDLRVAELLLGK